MERSEFTHLLAAIVILTIVIGAEPAFSGNWALIAQALFAAALIIMLSVGAKKLMAYSLDADVEHELWSVKRYGFAPSAQFKKPMPTGIILPLIFALFSLGKIKVMPLLTFETRAKKIRAAKRFGYYSYTEMTDWHNALISAAGTIVVLLLAVIIYFLPYNLEFLAKATAFYAFWNLLPISNLDGAQIFFGSRVLWSVLEVIALILTLYAIIL